MWMGVRVGLFWRVGGVRQRRATTGRAGSRERNVHDTDAVRKLGKVEHLLDADELVGCDKVRRGSASARARKEEASLTMTAISHGSNVSHALLELHLERLLRCIKVHNLLECSEEGISFHALA